MKLITLSFIAIFLTGCASHRMYETAQFRANELNYKRIAVLEKGLTSEQIDAITSTKPPQSFPVDVSIIIIKNGYVDTRLEEMFSYKLAQKLKTSDKIGRVTLIPDFLVPETISFNSIQELGVRSLSEYVLVFYLDASEFFRWTAIASSKYEVNSAVSFIIVDSGTSAMLTSDRLYSTSQYKDNLFEIGVQEKAQRAIFSEQAQLLGQKLDMLFKGK